MLGLAADIVPGVALGLEGCNTGRGAHDLLHGVLACNARLNQRQLLWIEVISLVGLDGLAGAEREAKNGNAKSCLQLFHGHDAPAPL